MGRRRLLPVSSSLVAGVSGQRRTLSRLGASKLFRFRFFFVVKGVITSVTTRCASRRARMRGKKEDSSARGGAEKRRRGRIRDSRGRFGPFWHGQSRVSLRLSRLTRMMMNVACDRACMQRKRGQGSRSTRGCLFLGECRNQGKKTIAFARAPLPLLLPQLDLPSTRWLRPLGPAAAPES